jgi:hypothetical protein
VKVDSIATFLVAHQPKGRGPDVSLFDKIMADETLARNTPAADFRSSSALSHEPQKTSALGVQAQAHQQGDHEQITPPAEQARSTLADHPALAALPFGKIVSALARGESLPAAPDAPAAGEQSRSGSAVDDTTSLSEGAQAPESKA